MALHEIVINIKSSGGSGIGSSSPNDASGGSPQKKKERTTFQKILNWDSELKEKMKSDLDPTSYLVAQSGVALAKQTGRAILSYYINDIGRQNGDANYQAQINHRLEQANDIMGAIGSALNGAAAGAMVAGPIGAGIGAMFGIASSVISIGYRQAERERAYTHEMFKLNTSQGYLLARANYSATTGRMR